MKIAEGVKKEFDERWTPYWHVILGRNFGSFVTHETRCFLYFYIGDKAVMIYKVREAAGWRWCCVWCVCAADDA